MKSIHDWFNSPGEKIKSIGFYINPYRRYVDSKFDHILAFDQDANLYIGQFSAFHDHMKEAFDENFEKIRYEYGSVNIKQPKVTFDFIEHKNVILLNRRLRLIAQRLYDYGMPKHTVIEAKDFDICSPSLFNILKGQFWERPS